jgi:hypothetical protein
LVSGEGSEWLEYEPKQHWAAGFFDKISIRHVGAEERIAVGQLSLRGDV